MRVNIWHASKKKKGGKTDVVSHVSLMIDPGLDCHNIQSQDFHNSVLKFKFRLITKLSSQPHKPILTFKLGFAHNSVSNFLVTPSVSRSLKTILIFIHIHMRLMRQSCDKPEFEFQYRVVEILGPNIMTV